MAGLYRVQKVGHLWACINCLHRGLWAYLL